MRELTARSLAKSAGFGQVPPLGKLAEFRRFTRSSNCMTAARETGLARKDLALLALQSLIFLPILVILTKGTAAMLLVAVVAGLAYTRSFPRIRVVNLAGLLLFVCAISAVWSIAPDISLKRCVKLAGFLLLLAVVVDIADRWTDEDRRFLARLCAWGWCIALVILLLFTVFEQEVIAAIRYLRPGEQTETHLATHKIVANNSVVVLVLTAFPALRILLSVRRGIYATGLAFAVLVFVAASSGSTSALLGLFAGVIVWAVYALKPGATVKFLAVALPGAILLMPFILSPLASNPDPLVRSIPGFPNSFVHRMVIWDFTIDRILERPLLGWGFDASRVIPEADVRRPVLIEVPWSDKPVKFADFQLPLHPHNGALQLWLELGLLGALTMAVVLRRLIRVQIGAAPAGNAGAMAGFFVAAMAIYCVAFGLMQSWWLSLLFLTWAAVKAAESVPATASTQAEIDP